MHSRPSTPTQSLSHFVRALKPRVSLFKSTLCKRGFDIVLSILFIICLSPVFVLIILVVVLSSPGGFLFKQTRTGYRGALFKIYKFRTLYPIEASTNKLESVKRSDVRVTPIGKFLRRTSMDELPQLFNVLKGDMSLVGPRPHALLHDVQYGKLIPNYKARFAVKPGLTGLAQVYHFRGTIDNASDLQARLRCDLYYINHWSLWLDVKILFRTFYVVFSHNAY